MLMDNLLLTLIGMLVTFVGVYIYMSKKIDQTNLSENIRLTRNSSKKISATKLELEKNRLKSEILHLFPKLTNEEQHQWINELTQLSENSPKQNQEAS